MTIKLENGVEVVGKSKDYYLMAEYDYHLIPDPEDYLLFIAGLYARVDMQKSAYPEELFNVGKDKSSGTCDASEQTQNTDSARQEEV